MPADESPEPDLPEDWWTSTQLRSYLAAHGFVFKRTTWSSRVRRGTAPPPDPKGQVGAYPRWRPEVIRAYLARLREQQQQRRDGARKSRRKAR